MKGRIILALVAPAVLAAAFASSSLGLTSELTVRSDATEFSLHDKSEKLKLQAKEPVHVDIRHVTFGANESTGWHGHAGPSLVVVKAGSLTVSAADGKACSVQTYNQNAAFVHSEDAHNFVAGASGAEIYIVYLLPSGAAPAPIGATQPAACP